MIALKDIRGKALLWNVLIVFILSLIGGGSALASSEVTLEKGKMFPKWSLGKVVDIETDSQGNMYVLSEDESMELQVASIEDGYGDLDAPNKILKFNAAGKFLGYISHYEVAGETETSPLLPVHIAVDDADLLYIFGYTLQDGPAIFKFSAAGEYIDHWSSESNTNVRGIDVDSAGRIYLLEGADYYTESRPGVVPYSADGTQGTVWDAVYNGAVMGYVDEISVLPNGKVIVLEERNIHLFDPFAETTNWEHTWELDESIDWAYKMDVDSDGNVYVYDDGEASKIHRISADQLTEVTTDTLIVEKSYELGDVDFYLESINVSKNDPMIIYGGLAGQVKGMKMVNDNQTSILDVTDFLAAPSLSNPMDVTTDRDGNIYVAEEVWIFTSTSERLETVVHTFNPDGEYEDTWFTGSTNMVGMTVDSSTGCIYAVGYLEQSLEILNSCGDPIFDFADDLGDVSFETFYPIDMAYGTSDQAGIIYVLDEYGRVIMLDGSGNSEGEFSIQEVGTGQGYEAYANSIAVDSKGQVYVLDSLNASIHAFEPEGEYIRTIDQGDSENPYLVNAQDIAIDAAGNVFVLESELHRILVFNSEGVKVGELAGYEDEFENALFVFPTALAINAEGDLMVVHNSYESNYGNVEVIGLNVIRSDSRLAKLEINGDDVSDQLVTGDTITYTVGPDVEGLTVTAVVYDPYATTDGEPVGNNDNGYNDEYKYEFTLSPGYNSFELNVWAEDGSHNTYTLKKYRESSPANGYVYHSAFGWVGTDSIYMIPNDVAVGEFLAYNSQYEYYENLSLPYGFTATVVDSNGDPVSDTANIISGMYLKVTNSNEQSKQFKLMLAPVIEVPGDDTGEPAQLNAGHILQYLKSNGAVDITGDGLFNKEDVKAILHMIEPAFIGTSTVTH